MIVTCGRCQSRFLIPDEKVGTKGVRVRCTSCQHTFRVAANPYLGENAPPSAVPVGQQATSTYALPNEGWGTNAMPPTTPSPGAAFYDEPLEETPPPPAFYAEQDFAPPSPLPPNLENVPSPFPDFDVNPDQGFSGATADPAFLQGELPSASPSKASVPKTEHTDEMGRVSIPETPYSVSLGSRFTPRPIRAIATWFANLAATALLIVLAVVMASAAMNEGKPEWPWHSWSRLQDSFVEPTGLLSLNISNGLYATQSGRDLFYVMGEIENRSAIRQRVQVKTQLLEGSSVLREVSAMAGAILSPHDLYAVSSQVDLEEKLKSLAEQAEVIPPGTRKPFLAVFFEYPPDLSAVQLKLHVGGVPAN